MKINLRTAVSRLFPNHSFEMIYIEAIANALDADATEITIDINYNNSEFSSFKIIDNGVGIDEVRYQRFSNLMDAQDASHKGQGRLVYLHYFDNINFESIYRKEQQLEKIIFNFNYNFDDSIYQKENIFSEETGTCVSFSEFSKDRLGSKESINSTRIKENILSEFLPAFHKMKEAGKNIKISINTNIDNNFSNEVISIDGIPEFEYLEIESDYLKNISPRLSEKVSYDLFREPLSLYYYVKKTSKKTSIVTSFAIDNRAIKVPIIDKENYIDGFDAIFFLYSKCFDGQVNPTRQELTIDKNDLKEIKKIFKSKIQDIFREKVPDFHNLQEKEKKYLKDKYPHLIGYISEDDIGFSSKKDILFQARDKFFDDQQSILEKENLTNEDYQKALELSSRNLAEYILFRQKQIDKLQKISLKDIEETIHDVICPRKNESSKTNFNIFKNNAWILDDRFMSFYSSFSDITLNKISKLNKDFFEEESGSQERPDFLLLFSKPQDEQKKDKEIDIVIFEFKRLNVGKHEKLKASSELVEYASEIKDLLSEDITVGRMWLYALVNIDDKFRRTLRNQDYKPRFSIQGEIWYRPYNELGLEVSYLDFNALVSDASSRNETFIRILKNDFNNE
ncbi:ATP-binding protein [Aggregatibacter actinomycetemcomitans]|uniref:ATP-binding protein n=1 Tax=Aggregatibacter actinomycetemcomitans TaxID=714 RepID=UPI00215199EC|nr:ATP-binding protein [Aggregatibacter actinomycetemcomitans]